MLKIKFIFRVTGGVVIQLEKDNEIYQKTFDQRHVAFAAQAVQIAIEAGQHLNLATFPDNEAENWLIPTEHEVRIGFYTVYSSLNELLTRGDINRRSIFMMKNILMVYNIEMMNRRDMRSSNSLIIKNAT